MTSSGGLGAGTGGGASSDGKLLQEATTRMADILAASVGAAAAAAVARSRLLEPRSAAPVIATVRHVCTRSCGTGTQPSSSNASSSLEAAPSAASRYCVALGGAVGEPTYSADAVSTDRTVCGAAGGMAWERARFGGTRRVHGRWDAARATSATQCFC